MGIKTSIIYRKEKVTRNTNILDLDQNISVSACEGERTDVPIQRHILPECSFK